MDTIQYTGWKIKNITDSIGEIDLHESQNPSSAEKQKCRSLDKNNIVIASHLSTMNPSSSSKAAPHMKGTRETVQQSVRCFKFQLSSSKTTCSSKQLDITPQTVAKEKALQSTNHIPAIGQCSKTQNSTSSNSARSKRLISLAHGSVPTTFKQQNVQSSFITQTEHTVTLRQNVYADCKLELFRPGRRKETPSPVCIKMKDSQKNQSTNRTCFKSPLSSSLITNEMNMSINKTQWYSFDHSGKNANGAWRVQYSCDNSPTSTEVSDDRSPGVSEASSEDCCVPHKSHSLPSARVMIKSPYDCEDLLQNLETDCAKLRRQNYRVAKITLQRDQRGSAKLSGHLDELHPQSMVHAYTPAFRAHPLNAAFYRTRESKGTQSAPKYQHFPHPPEAVMEMTEGNVALSTILHASDEGLSQTCIERNPVKIKWKGAKVKNTLVHKPALKRMTPDQQCYITSRMLSLSHKNKHKSLWSAWVSSKERQVIQNF
ncbi:uncharacterized protein LOC131739972 [Acipenser ruthenus]|uniref:uncharacterized protein LOC131739972 n=1 Tax=Acipenser ruthenus TaxID=7906 RepID=UPI002741204B|nr:uncharacterized protein LOC131739972 [Acipenser ruthenus]